MEAMPIVSPFVPLPRRAKRCRQYNHRSRPKVDVRTSRNFSPAIISESYKVITKSKGLLSNEWLKVNKSQKQFFLKLHCPKNERNIRQNSAL